LGANSRQMIASQAAEFAAIGALAGLLAAIGASALGWVLAAHVLNVGYTFNPWIWLVGFTGGTLGVLGAGLIGTRRALSAAPMTLFREAT
jgi:putative ABC transport system permease protein